MKMAEIREFVVGFVGVIIGIAVAVSLLPVISDSINGANLTGTTATLVGLTPLLVGVGILLFVVKAMF
jgi:uncharacterized membrane protein YcjF (UPF0283 family)